MMRFVNPLINLPFGLDYRSRSRLGFTDCGGASEISINALSLALFSAMVIGLRLAFLLDLQYLVLFL